MATCKIMEIRNKTENSKDCSAPEEFVDLCQTKIIRRSTGSNTMAHGDYDAQSLPHQLLGVMYDSGKLNSANEHVQCA